MIQVTIIIPIYNVAQYIERCLHSVFNQSYPYIDYVLINDCSEDNSLEIVERIIDTYPQHQSSILLINHECNQGIAKTRTESLQYVKGEAFLFVDGDDWIERDMVECLVKQMHDADICECGYFEEWNGRTDKISPHFTTDLSENINRAFSGEIFCSLWNKLIRSELLKDFTFPTLQIGEDKFAILHALSHARKVTTCSSFLYHYNRQNISSATSKLSIHQIMLLADYTYELAKKTGLYKSHKHAVDQGTFLLKKKLLEQSSFDKHFLFDFHPEANYIYLEMPLGRVMYLRIRVLLSLHKCGIL